MKQYPELEKEPEGYEQDSKGHPTGILPRRDIRGRTFMLAGVETDGRKAQYIAHDLRTHDGWHVIVKKRVKVKYEVWVHVPDDEVETEGAPTDMRLAETAE